MSSKLVILTSILVIMSSILVVQPRRHTRSRAHEHPPKYGLTPASVGTMAHSGNWDGILAMTTAAQLPNTKRLVVMAAQLPNTNRPVTASAFCEAVPFRRRLSQVSHCERLPRTRWVLRSRPIPETLVTGLSLRELHVVRGQHAC